MRGIFCSKCKTEAHGGTLTGSKFICRNCELVDKKKKRDANMAKQVKAEDTKLRAHMKKNKKCMCGVCQAVRKMDGK